MMNQTDIQANPSMQPYTMDLSPEKDPHTLPDPESQLRQILLELGTPDNLLGHAYVVAAVLMCFEDRLYIKSITFGLYPQVAAKFGTTASRVERAIRCLIEVTWARGDLNAINRYFGNTVKPARGRPTNGEFITRLTNILRLQMKQAV